MKRVVSIILAVVLIAGVCAANAASSTSSATDSTVTIIATYVQLYQTTGDLNDRDMDTLYVAGLLYVTARMATPISYYQIDGDTARSMLVGWNGILEKLVNDRAAFDKGEISRETYLMFFVSMMESFVKTNR